MFTGVQQTKIQQIISSWSKGYDEWFNIVSRGANTGEPILIHHMDATPFEHQPK